MAESPQKLSRTILYLKNLTIRIHVKLVDTNFNFHNEFSYGNKTYLKLDPSVYLTLEMSKGEEGFVQDKTILLTQMNINQVIMSMKKVLKNIYNEKIFAMRGNEIIVYEDMSKKYTEKLMIPNSNQALMIKPSVIYDENETSYEGVHMFINKLENIIELSIDEFESVIYTLSQVNLFEYSQLLINYAMIKYPNGYIVNDKPLTQKKKTSINWEQQNNDAVHSTFKKTSDNNIFNGLKSDEI